MSKEFSYRDATKPLTLHVTKEDIAGAVPGDVRNCVLARTVRREHKCFDIQCFRTVVYVRRREDSIPDRYQVSQSAKDLLMTWDASGRAHPITVTLMPPRWAISQRKFRTKKHREANTRSKAAGRLKDTKLRRAYTKPDPLTLWGVRNGAGVKPTGSGRLPKPR